MISASAQFKDKVFFINIPYGNCKLIICKVYQTQELISQTTKMADVKRNKKLTIIFLCCGWNLTCNLSIKKGYGWVFQTTQKTTRVNTLAHNTRFKPRKSKFFH